LDGSEKDEVRPSSANLDKLITCLGAIEHKGTKELFKEELARIFNK
jgi:hypothetical protein